MTEKEKELKEKIKLQKHFGIELVKIRKSKNISAAELARLCFMERSSIARLEKGGANPSLFIIKKLCKALDVSISDLTKEL